MLSVFLYCENGRLHLKTLETLLLLVDFLVAGFFLLLLFVLLPFVLHCFAFCTVNAEEVYLHGVQINLLRFYILV